MRASDEEVKRLRDELVRMSDPPFHGDWWLYIARYLMEVRGCKAPPDPVEEIFRKAVAEGVYRNEGPSMVYAAPPKALADYLLARFNVTPKGGDDA